MLEQTDTMLRETALDNAVQDDTVPPSAEAMITATVSCPQPDTTVCTVTGTVNLATAPLLAGTLSDAVHDDRSHLVVDLSAAVLLDSTGLLAVFDALDSYEIGGHLAVVAHPYSEAFTRPEFAVLNELLDIHRDLGSALRACAQASLRTAGRHRAQTGYQPRPLG